MPAESGQDSMRGDETTHFAHALSTLKQRGSALLVVGTVPEEMYARTSTQMMGDQNTANPRRRLLVTSDGLAESAAERLRDTGPLAPQFARVISNDVSARGAAATSPTTSPPGPTDGAAPSRPSGGPREHRVDDTIADTGTAFTEVINQFDVAAGGLEPAELRVAFDCLPAFLSRYETADVFTFVHFLTTYVRLFDGMAHFRLPRARTDLAVRRFEPLFDAVIELRVDGSELKQRWHFRDEPVVSEWLSVEYM